LSDYNMDFRYVEEEIFGAGKLTAGPIDPAVVET
jgi:hypothetical protein